MPFFTHLPQNCAVREWSLISEDNMGYGRTRIFSFDWKWILKSCQADCVKRWEPWSYLACEGYEFHVALQLRIIIWNVYGLGCVIKYNLLYLTIFFFLNILPGVKTKFAPHSWFLAQVLTYTFKHFRIRSVRKAGHPNGKSDVRDLF